MKGLLIGRFQPFHKGHLYVIRKILEEADELIIVIGSSQYKDTRENPFSAQEREAMIKKALDSEGIQGYRVFKVPDIDNDDLYPGHVMDIVPPFDVVFSGNSLVLRLFKAAGKEVRAVEHVRRGEYSGSGIRQRIHERVKWKHLVPSSLHGYLEEIRCEERVKKLHSS